MSEEPRQKRRKPVSHVPRTLARLRAEGYCAEVVERRVPRSFVTKDLIGCIDVLAFGPGRGFLGVQVCRHSDGATRMLKALAEPRLATWVLSGGRFEVWGWVKRGARWQVVRRRVRLADGRVETV